MSGFRQKTLTGITWSIVSQVGRQGFTFVIGVVLARLLSPREFGLIAMVTVITGFAGIFAEFGFSAALIQKQEVQPEHLSSVFWLNLASGLLLMVILMSSSLLIAGFYNEPLLVPLTVLISTNFFFQSASIIQRMLMRKTLNFRTLSMVDVAMIAVSGGVAIVMAYAGFGVWSLAVRSVVGSAVAMALLWRLSDWRPGFTFQWQAVKELLGFSLNLLGTRTLGYWARNIDNLLIGRFLGSNPLGVYSRAYSVLLFPLTNVSLVLSRVMFPSYSIIQEDKRRVKNMHLKITRAIALITFPLAFGLLVTVEPFVISVFGLHWAEMIPILRVFCIVGLIQSVVSLNGSLYLSQGRSNLQLGVAFPLRANSLLGIVIGLRWGGIGVAIGYATAALINFCPSIYFGGKLIGLTFTEFLRNLSEVFLCGAAMAAAVWGLGLWLPADWPHWGYLATQVLFGAVVYFLLIYVFKVQAYLDLQTLAMEQWRLHRERQGVPAKEAIA